MYGNSTKFYDRIIHFIPFFQSEFFILTSIIGICIVVVSILTLFKKNINLKLFDFKNIILLIST
jgi:hypothetical protein